MASTSQSISLIEKLIKQHLTNEETHEEVLDDDGNRDIRE
jgi:hypothetical protein